MRINDIILEALTEAQAKNVTVVYGGRFQPMHQGHYLLYSKLVKQFGQENVFIATTFSKEAEKEHRAGNFSKNPFTFDEKAGIIKKMFGITNVVQTSPYRPDLSKMGRNSDDSAVVLVFSAKDAGRLKSSPTIHPLPKDLSAMESYTENGDINRAYLLEMPIEKGGMSATDFRNDMANPELAIEEKQKTFVNFFGKFDQEVFDIIVERVSS
jgi:hypothetical protein